MRTGLKRAWLTAGLVLAVAGDPGAALASVHYGQPVIFTITGNGTAATAGNGGKAARAEVDQPWGLVEDDKGDLYVSEYEGNVIRKIAADGTISTYAGTGTAGGTGDGGPATSAELNHPAGLAIDRSGDIYVVDEYNQAVRKIDARTGDIAAVAGMIGSQGYAGDGGPATSAKLNYPQGVAVSPAGNLYIADGGNNRIREVKASTGDISTVAGDGSTGFSGDGGPATSAKLHNPTDVTFDPAGNMYIADYQNKRVRKVDTAGIISTVAGGGADAVAGPATGVSIAYPSAVAIDPVGGFFISSYSFKMRQVNHGGHLTFVVGNNVTSTGYSGDGGRPADAKFGGRAWGIWATKQGNLIFADSMNNRVRYADLHPPGVADHWLTDPKHDAVTTDVLVGGVGSGLYVLSFTQPRHGRVTDPASRMLTYAPDKRFTGTDRFDYTVSDSVGLQAKAWGVTGILPKATATVTITVGTEHPHQSGQKHHHRHRRWHRAAITFGRAALP
jgi:hypothetical protein